MVWSDLHRQSACRETKALRSGTRRNGAREGQEGRSAASVQRGVRVREGVGRRNAPRVDERDGVRCRATRGRRKENLSRGWEGKGREGEEEKGELFRFLTTSERHRLRRLSARPTRDSYVCSVLVFFFLFLFSCALAKILFVQSKLNGL